MKFVYLLNRCILFSFFTVLTTSCGPSKPVEIKEAEAGLPEIVDYNYHVKPILSDRCFTCHGPDEKALKAGLRLDIPELATSELEESPGNYAIVPRRLGKSELFHRVVSDDPDYLMPPPESNLSLSVEEKAILFKWIEQGATYKEHWAFIAPDTLQEVPMGEWGRNEIDQFIADRLQQEGLVPSEEANKETLIRRASFDLTGLPPTINEIDNFLADESPNAFEKVVDRLLASNAYGERMAAEWMDVARYADSHGYQDDGMRNMWPWRDWVIDAFNDNLPFDDFLTWQLAGDLLPDATPEQILATGFNRNHMQSQEGGIVLEEYRVEYVADRTNTLGTAFLGLTLQCARCHDHKYDPISQKEYFQLFGFFNSVNEIGVIPYAGEASPTVILLDEEAEERIAVLNAQIHQLEELSDFNNADYDARFEQWLETTASGGEALIMTEKAGHYPLDTINDFTLTNTVNSAQTARVGGDREFPPEIVEGHEGTAVLLNGESWVDMGKDRYYYDRNESFSVGVWVNIREDSVSGPLVGKSNSLFDGNRGYFTWLHEDGTISASLNHVAPDNSIKIRSVDPVDINTWNHIVMTYDGSSSAKGLKLYLNGQPLPATIVVDNLHKSILFTYNFYKQEQTNWTGNGHFRIGMVGPNQTRTAGVAFDNVDLFASMLTPLEVRALYGEENVLGSALEARASGDQAIINQLRAYYVSRFEPAYQEAGRKLHVLRGEVNEIMTRQQEVMVMRDLEEPRPTYVLARGAYDAPEEKVEPGFPDVLPAMAESVLKNRLGLANWLTDPAHPLTARVTVNRYWQMVFGRGLVSTPDDFGSQGALPSHPELLDWLAVHFIESGWDVKAFMKMLVMSSTYRQSSVASPELHERDPDNRLLARAPSYRLTAEMIRDNTLAASGLLVPTIGGPSVHPYQPEGLWKQLATRNETEYKQDGGDKLYRRSMYTIWKRSTPPPSMISFDASERNVCVVQRQKTSSPLQALVLLNDPQYVEASRILAERMIREGGATIDLQVIHGFRLLTGRFPSDSEVSMLSELFEQELFYFEEHPAEVNALLAVGDYPHDSSLDGAEVAATTMVANTIMNFDEAYIKR